jgi:transcriptional regulator with XRE-family HTH domain
VALPSFQQEKPPASGSRGLVRGTAQVLVKTLDLVDPRVSNGALRELVEPVVIQPGLGGDHAERSLPGVQQGHGPFQQCLGAHDTSLVKNYCYCKQHFTRRRHYDFGMKPRAESVIAENLRALLERDGLNATTLSKRMGGKPSQKTINNILNERNSPSVETVEALAAYFHLEAWELMVPWLGGSVKSAGKVSGLVRKYLAMGEEGKSFIEHAADRELKKTP